MRILIGDANTPTVHDFRGDDLHHQQSVAMLDLETLLQEYRDVGDATGVEPQVVQAIETRLDVTLPTEFKRVASVFPGGPLGGVRHFQISNAGESSIVEQTEELRKQGLRHDNVAVAMSKTHIFLMETEGGGVAGVGTGERDWINAHNTDTSDPRSFIWFPTYATFFRQLVSSARYKVLLKSLRRQHPGLVPARAREWRHRWSSDETRQICERLRNGTLGGLRLDKVTIDGIDFTDLRGLCIPSGTFLGDPNGVRKAMLDRIDFSFSEGVFTDIDARRCRFAGASVRLVRSQLQNCDFTFLSSMGEVLNGEFVDCKFVAAQLQNAVLKGKFRRCDFTGADLDGAAPHGEFTDCIWTGCRLGGYLGHWAQIVYREPDKLPGEL